MDFPTDYQQVLDPRPTNVKRGSIRLTYQMAFNLACDREGLHENHPDKVTFAKGARLGAELWSSGQAVVEGVFHEHTFRFERDQYEIEGADRWADENPDHAMDRVLDR